LTLQVGNAAKMQWKYEVARYRPSGIPISHYHATSPN